MKRRDAARRHRLLVTIIAALSGVILVLLAAFVPRFEEAYQDFGLEAPAPPRALFGLGRWVNDRLWMVVPLWIVFLGLLWTSYGLLHRRDRAEGP